MISSLKSRGAIESRELATAVRVDKDIHLCCVVQDVCRYWIILPDCNAIASLAGRMQVVYYTMLCMSNNVRRFIFSMTLPGPRVYP